MSETVDFSKKDAAAAYGSPTSTARATSAEVVGETRLATDLAASAVRRMFPKPSRGFMVS